ncbi:MAG: cytochrome-c peroxidase [Candidatus Thiodiazotropha sp. (ex Monitilora ramsayi)]|nr:cytochrome-c peroxidase [Candidatus Thiodiazotropha sp. (ex Monitilora ramsayi)]
MFNYLIILIIYLLSANVQGAEVRNEPIKPLPLHQPDLNLKLVDLGDRLFHDPRLSQDNSISCASCHVLSSGGTDRLPVSVGVGGAKGGIKAPTVYNSSFNFVQFWDGRVDTLEDQAAGPVHNPLEMNSNWTEVIGKLQNDQEIVVSFRSLFDDGITPENIVAAIAEFEKSLVTANSRFDRWLLGDDSALTDFELIGYRLFKSYGCISCHQGANVGGNLYAYMGAMGDYFKDRKSVVTTADFGRFNVTGKEDDKHFFKVPSLRLAAINSPYFHDASVQTLSEAVLVMGRYQLGREISASDVDAIVAFISSLLGEHHRLKP